MDWLVVYLFGKFGGFCVGGKDYLFDMIDC